MIGQRKILEMPQIEYFEVCTSEFHFGDSILKESETNITDNWTGVREQCFNQQIDRPPGRVTIRFFLKYLKNVRHRRLFSQRFRKHESLLFHCLIEKTQQMSQFYRSYSRFDTTKFNFFIATGQRLYLRCSWKILH